MSLTTVQDIAQAAGVAPATVYQAFGTKHAVLSPRWNRTIAGDDSPLAVPIEIGSTRRVGRTNVGGGCGSSSRAHPRSQRALLR